MPPPLSENQKDAAREFISLFSRWSLACFAVGAVLLGWAFEKLQAGKDDTITQLGFDAAVALFALSFLLVGAAVYCIVRIWRSK